MTLNVVVELLNEWIRDGGGAGERNAAIFVGQREHLLTSVDVSAATDSAI
jgi:hypothetical protein